MRIDQIIPAMRYGYEIGNMVLVLQKIINDIGFKSDIFTEASQPDKIESVIYHMFMGSNAHKTLTDLRPRKKFLFYHGIMPPAYFENHQLQIDLQRGRRELKALGNYFTFAFTTTNYLEDELCEAGHSRTAVLPLPIDLREYNQEPDGKLLDKYDDDHTNILFVGQITPNKKLENVISIFNYYHKKMNPKSRLFLVGSFLAHAGYCQQLLALIKELEIKNVYLTGRVSFKQLLAYYHLSSIFLHLSEYEGFSIPLIEAMYLEVPIIALDRAAVSEVLDGSACLIDDCDMRETARLLDRLANDRDMRDEIKSRQWERVTEYMPENIFPVYRDVIKEAYYFAD